MAGVIGNRIRVCSGDLCEWVRWIPACTNCRRGSDENSLGSGRPRVICMCLMPANSLRTQLLADQIRREVTQSKDSDTGNGNKIEYNEQNAANLRRADWYVLCVDSAIPFSQKC